MKRLLCLAAVFAVAVNCSCSSKQPAAPESTAAKRFCSPDDAAAALAIAVAKEDRTALLGIFGAGSKGLLDSGDAVADKNAFEEFSAEIAKRKSVEAQPDGTYVLYVGEKEWPFPVPIVSDGKKWSFDADAGREEILDRRIGENELKTIRLSRAFVEAENEYFKKDRDGDGVREYAQKALSSPGKKDGLFWQTSDPKDQSPFGPLAAEAVREGYSKQGDAPTPFHGYFFKLLSKQGMNADGGEKSYLDSRGNMTTGYALLAYPARYGASGVMTFTVNQQGIVYEKDFGTETLENAEATTVFNPDSSWSPVDDPNEDKVDE